MSELTIQLDPRQLAEITRELRDIPNGVRRVMVPAINRTMATGRSRVVKIGAAQTGLQQKEVRKSIGTVKATPARHYATIRISGRRIPLIKFHARQTSEGVVTRLPDRGVDHHAFIATMPSGHRGVYRRRTKRRLPIDQLYGPGMADVFRAAGALERITRDLDPILFKNVASQVDRLLQRRKADR